MPDEFPSVSLPAGGYRRDFPEPEAPLDPGPTDGTEASGPTP